MVEMDDIQTLLQTGSWKTSRSRSPNPHGRDYDRTYDRSHDRKDEYNRPRHDGDLYRPDARSSRSTAGLARRPRRPPPPSVESEVESLAREYPPSSAPSSPPEDEPKNRGEIDQYPLLFSADGDETPVLEENPERRFVLVSGAGGDTEETQPKPDGERRFVLVSGAGTEPEKTKEKPSADHRHSPTKPRRDDRNGNARAEVSDEDDKAPRKRPDLSKRRSRQDLPPLETEFQQEEPSIRRSISRRNKEKPIVDQEPPRSARPADNGFLAPSPVVRTANAGGRERAYIDLNAGLSRSPGERARGPRDIPKSSRPENSRRSTHSSTSSSTPRRLSTSASGGRPYVDAMTFMRQGGEVSSRDRTSVSPTKTRKSASPPYPSSSRDRPSERPMGQRSRRESDAPEQADYYGGSSRSNRSDRLASRRTVEPEPLLSPEKSRPIPIGRDGLKGPSPLPSPRASQGGQFSDVSSSFTSRSSTLPVSLDRRKPDEYFPPVSSTTSASPPQRADDGDRATRPRAPSRSSSAVNDGVAVPPLAASALAAGAVATASLGRGNTAERRNPEIVHEEEGESESPAKYWQPGPFDPETQGVHLDHPVVSWRRYSEDVQQGNLPQLPECRWTVPSIPRSGAGGPLFLTLPRANNFTICPDCFAGAFAKKPEFVQKFVPAPFRSPDQAVSCDFGSSPWYRIAYLMTLKYRYPDLRLLENVAAVAARHQDCPGAQPSSRMWYSMTDPRSRRPISSFMVCSSCAHMVGALLPNLAGIFTPLDPHAAPTKSICDLHFAPERKRFLDYFDVLETSSDRARRSIPDIQDIANQIRDISLIEECYRNTLLQSSKWYVMAGLPEFTVCEECYDTVVWPLIEDENNPGDVTRNFIRNRQTIPVASCQLYSERMRKVFKDAYRKNDLEYLVMEVRKKLATEYAIKNQYSLLLQQDHQDPAVQKQRLELMRKLKEIE